MGLNKLKKKKEQQQKKTMEQKKKYQHCETYDPLSLDNAGYKKYFKI